MKGQIDSPDSGKFVTDQERARDEKRSLASIRRERKRGAGPPHIVLGGLVRYPVPPYREWLLKKMSEAAAGPERNAHFLKANDAL
jgi:hypothetical protein